MISKYEISRECQGVHHACVLCYLEERVADRGISLHSYGQGKVDRTSETDLCQG